jgi:hypothetical protein
MNNKFSIPGNRPRSVEADKIDELTKKEMKRKASEPIPPGRLAALVAQLSTKEKKGGKRNGL